jgi:trk system potassium uptake protein TrkA
MHVIVLGCGRVGSGLAYRLETDGHVVTVVDRDTRAFVRLGPGTRARRIVGEALDRDVLEAAGIGQADAVAAVTGRDEVNAVVARIASQRLHVPRVVARMYDPRQADLYQRLGVLTISPVQWGISRLGHLISVRDISPVAVLGGGQVELVEARVPPTMSGRRSAELEIPGEARLVTVTRGGRTFLEDGTTPIEAGDVVSIAVTSDAVVRLQQLLSVS